MYDSREVLTSLLKAAQQGQTVIRSVLDQAMDTELADILKDQLQELVGIESESRSLASQRGWELEELKLAERFMTDRRSRRMLRFEGSNSAIADLMIQSNTKAKILGLKALHGYPGRNGIAVLSQKLIDCQTSTIQQLESFL